MAERLLSASLLLVSTTGMIDCFKLDGPLNGLSFLLLAALAKAEVVAAVDLAATFPVGFDVDRRSVPLRIFLATPGKIGHEWKPKSSQQSGQESRCCCRRTCCRT